MHALALLYINKHRCLALPIPMIWLGQI